MKEKFLNTIKENKIIYIINLIFLVAIMLSDIGYILSEMLVVKAVTSALFVLLGVVNMIALFSKNGEGKRFSILMLAGLVFAMLGDIFININFISGAILFAVGHVLFVFAYICIQHFTYKDIIRWAIIFLISTLLILFLPMLEFDSLVMKLVCIIYACIISLMLAKANSNFISTKSLLTMIILIGSILFFFSDFMLLLNVFGNMGNLTSVLCLVSYYLAEFLLAHSILFSGSSKTN